MSVSDTSVQQTQTMSDILSETDLYTSQLSSLPDRSSFKSQIESDLWDELTTVSNPGETVGYEDLTEAGQSVIGYQTTDEDEDPALPWWLLEFEWTVSYGEEELVLDSTENIDALASFGQSRTKIHQPKLKSGSSGGPTALYMYEQLLQLRAALQRHHSETPSGSSDFKLPDELFVIDTEVITLTEEFTDWVDRYVGLLPGYSTHATALLNAQTKTGQESAKAVLSEGLYNAVEFAGLIDEGRLYNSEILEPLVNLLSAHRFFSLTFPVPETYDALSGLEYVYYESFAAAGPYDDETTNYLQRAVRDSPGSLDRGTRPKFTYAAFGSPLLFKRDIPSFITIGVYANSSKYYGSDSEKVSAVRRLMQDHELV